MPVQIGRLDRRITIQTPTETQDSYGEPVITWSDLTTVWASVTPSSSQTGEQFEADQVHAQRASVFRIRFNRNVTEKHRIVYDSDNYDILQIVEGGRREWQDITAVVRELP